MDAPATAAPLLKSTFTIRVLGVGGAGCNAVGHLAERELAGMSFSALNTDAAALARSPVAQKLVLGARLTRGLGAGGDPECGRAAAEEDAAAIRALCEGADLVFVVAGLGGGTGTGAGPVVARIARECGALVLGVVILPFECEGGRRRRQAQLGLQRLKEAADGVICLPNQRVFKFIDEKTSLLEAFRITNEFVAGGLRGLWRVLSKPGLINVDFADLSAATRGRHAESSLVTVEARGEQRAREVVEKLLAHPLIDGGQVLADADALLVCVAGGPELSLAEVHRVTEQLGRHCEHAHLTLGAAVEEELTERLVVTLIATKGGPQPAPAQPPGVTVSASASSGVPTPATDLADLDADDPARAGSPPLPGLAQPRPSGRGRKSAAKLSQGQLPLEAVTKGRFEKSEPTIRHGQDLDLPTYQRRNVALN
jgi:cell division protein FtsZ